MNSLPIIEFVMMLTIDLCFILVVLLVMIAIGVRRKAAFAVMKRNFAGYFSNPTGYVFLCIFVLLTSFAAFWPHEFFTTNLANFDQLNRFLPYIMLVFIPAITMSIWAEERRQGTDELLLTLPAKDFDIVIGKYFAAVLVYTVSLLFSQLSNYAVLLAMTGGQLDTFLLFSTYLGYWFMGIAMLSLGMVASFLTNNLTVGFIFGAAFNAPLAFFSNADVILSSGKWVQRLFDWSLLQRFEPFGRGLVSLPSAFYFFGIAIIGIYLSLILIGRRHWLGGRDGTNMFWHYMLRAGFLVAAVIAGVVVVQHSPLNRTRIDISSAKVSTLSDATVQMLNTLSQETDKPPVKIEAFVSNNIPTEYVQTKYNLVNLLREFDVLGGDRVQVNLRQGIEPFSEEAILAEKRFGIRPKRVASQSRGAIREEQVVMGASFTSGRERVVIDFFPYGMPVEYELMRSINTVSKSERKTIGILQTDAMAGGAMINVQGRNKVIPRLQIIKELEKQYDIESVVATSPVSLWLEDDDGKPSERRYDVILAIQPSKLSPVELQYFIDVIQSGQPVAIFEDPLPNQSNFPGRIMQGQRQSDQSFIMTGTHIPRTVNRHTLDAADIQRLWDALDVDIARDRIPNTLTNKPQYISRIVWQLASENPYPRDNRLSGTPEILVINQEVENSPDPRFSATHPAAEGLKQLCLEFAGYVAPKPNTNLTFDDIAWTGRCGEIRLDHYLSREREKKRGDIKQSYVVATHILGSNQSKDAPPSADKIEKSKQRTNVIYVADVDLLSDRFVTLRNFPIEDGIKYNFQNMALVLNIIDTLASENTYLSLRSRKIQHLTLKKVEETTEVALQEQYVVRQKLAIEQSLAEKEIESNIEREIGPRFEEIQILETKLNAGEEIDVQDYNRKKEWLRQLQQDERRKYTQRLQELQNERREAERQIELDAELKIQDIQRKFKLAAVVLPPIPPLLVGGIVWTRRRLREREGISKARRLK